MKNLADNWSEGNNSERTAFTLIEILIVMAIVAMLAIVAVASFGSARQNAKISFAAEGVISLLKTQEINSLAGKVQLVSDDSKPLCYGVRFSDRSPYVSSIIVPYIGVPPSNGDQTKADYCDLNSTLLPAINYDGFEGYQIKLLESLGNAVGGDYFVMFKPPRGTVVYGQAGSLNDVNSPELSLGNGSKVKIVIGSELSSDTRTIVYDIVNRTAQVINPGQSVDLGSSANSTQ